MTPRRRRHVCTALYTSLLILDIQGRAEMISPPMARRDAVRKPTQASTRSSPRRRRSSWGSVALLLCTTVHLLHTGFANIFGTSVSEATMRPNPRPS
jgi:hypothetical protein